MRESKEQKFHVVKQKGRQVTDLECSSSGKVSKESTEPSAMENWMQGSWHVINNN